MKIEDIKIGMKVRIREWDDMVREYGLNLFGDLAVEFGFTKGMRELCGVCAEVASIIGNKIKFSKHFDGPWGPYAISADMLEPIAEEFTMPPPPDLGELHGVKLPAWFWSTYSKRMAYVVFCGCDSIFITYIHEGVVCNSRAELLELYTGQDLPPKLSVDELKSLAGLVNNVR